MRPFHLIAAILTLLFAAPHAQAAPAPPFTATLEGKGPDIILIPGLASSAAVWDTTAEGLKATHRVHRIQVAGFAGAPAAGNGEGLVVAPLADAIAAYIADNKLERPAVIGHSLGGEAALMLAARHPGSVGRVMVVDALPFYSLLFNPAATPETVRPQADALRDMVLAQSDAQAAAAGTATLARMIKTEAARPAAVAWSNASDRSVVARAMHELLTSDLRGELTRIAVPSRSSTPTIRSTASPPRGSTASSGPLTRMPTQPRSSASTGASISSCSISPRPSATRWTASSPRGDSAAGAAGGCSGAGANPDL